MKEYDNFLSLEVIWKDDDILEIELTASNGGFSGVARGYDTESSLKILATQLEGFPKDDQLVIYEVEKAETGYFTISFDPSLATGRIKVTAYLECKGLPDLRNSTVSLEFLVHLGYIDIFQKFVANMAANREGKAHLRAS